MLKKFRNIQVLFEHSASVGYVLAAGTIVALKHAFLVDYNRIHRETCNIKYVNLAHVTISFKYFTFNK